jgi:glycyl-tRNA synthetase beta chain
MSELFIELFSEEIPARMQRSGAKALLDILTKKLSEAGFTFDKSEFLVTPRRIALIVNGLPEKQPDIKEEKKGPKEGSPEQALQGFMRGAGIASLDEAELRETPKGNFYFAVKEIKGQPTLDILPGLIVETIQAMVWPKSQKWSRHDFRWVRPLHSIIALFNGDVIKGELPLSATSSIEFGNLSKGHRFLAPGDFTVTGFDEYKSELAKAKVVLDHNERQTHILDGITKLASSKGLVVIDDPKLLEEVTGLVEWPVPLIGRIDDNLMALPPEVLTTSMREHQKYFATVDSKGELAPYFITISNMETADKGAAIVAGNERVLRARLADAEFFWNQDRKKGLASRIPALNSIVFHAKLGSVGDKIDRIAPIAVALAEAIPGANTDQVRSAARLCKADLVTGMVGEFPELQGLMGQYYAENDGETQAVAKAIGEHYSPLGPSDPCPTAPVSVAVAMADKLDSLAGFWAIDEKPTGSKDPFALRRSALGIIRLVLENELRLGLRPAIETALSLQPVEGVDQKTAAQDLLNFIVDRMKVSLREKGVRHDLIAAVFAKGEEDDLLRGLNRVEALARLVESDDGTNLLAAYRRASSILSKEEKKDKRSFSDAVQTSLLKDEHEATFHKLLNQTSQAAGSAIENEDYGSAMTAMASLRAPGDAFFDNVMVNAPEAEIRENRLNLLNLLRQTVSTVADFSKIES